MTSTQAPPVTVTPLRPFGLLMEVTGKSLAEAPVEQLRDNVLRHGLVVVRGCPPLDTREFAAFAETWGELLAWDFGVVLELYEQEDPKNFLFANGSVPLHWDGAFAHAVPSFQLFQCLEADGDGGGETVFVDSARVYERASAEQQARWRATTVAYEMEKVAHFGGRITAPVVAAHPRTGETVLRFAEPLREDTADINHPEVRVLDHSPGEGRELIDELVTALYADEVVYRHAWRTGDFVLTDNHGLLHGRTAFHGPSRRRLQRIQVI